VQFIATSGIQNTIFRSIYFKIYKAFIEKLIELLNKKIHMKAKKMNLIILLKFERK